MKRLITNCDDVVFLTRIVPIGEPKHSMEALQKIYDYCKDQDSFSLCDALIMAFNYGYALGKHDERKRVNRTANTENPKA